MLELRIELENALMSDKPSIEIQKMIDNGNLEKILPQFIECVNFNRNGNNNKKGPSSIAEHTFMVLDHTDKDLALRISALFHDIAKPKVFDGMHPETGKALFPNHAEVSSMLCKLWMTRMDYDLHMIDEVYHIIRLHSKKMFNCNYTRIGKMLDACNGMKLDKIFALQISDLHGRHLSKNVKKKIYEVNQSLHKYKSI